MKKKASFWHQNDQGMWLWWSSFQAFGAEKSDLKARRHFGWVRMTEFGSQCDARRESLPSNATKCWFHVFVFHEPLVVECQTYCGGTPKRRIIPSSDKPLSHICYMIFKAFRHFLFFFRNNDKGWNTFTRFFCEHNLVLWLSNSSWFFFVFFVCFMSFNF